jgi:hypothetical protein
MYVAVKHAPPVKFNALELEESMYTPQLVVTFAPLLMLTALLADGASA